ncbi:alpha-galactosidase [Paenibacillus sp. YN15]|uniref:alpha-galactosidase n=1 Tax=Paenibacillus sp. YN15 TaxID=1742774 RepID=UPI000DCBBF2E|nr:alpha-galactosidase [Paenibacillus sp. YN15]RAU93858.1 hypothetical protein DQG13_24940 [Paenibacillus sp. YN15]
MNKVKTIGQWQDCYVLADGERIAVGNSRIERSWSFAGGRLACVSLLDKTGKEEWIKLDGSAALAFALPWQAVNEEAAAWIAASADTDDDCGIACKHLRAHIDMAFPGMGLTVRLSAAIYPDSPFIRQVLTVKACTPRPSDSGKPAGLLLWEERRDKDKNTDKREEDGSPVLDNNATQQLAAAEGGYLDALELNHLHCRWETAAFYDRTDTNNNLASHEHGLLYRNERRGLKGNLMFFRRTLAKAGLVLIKEGPTPLGQLEEPGLDFQLTGCRLAIMGTGIRREEADGEEICTYGSTVGVFDGSEYGGLRLLHDYHSSIRVFRPERDAFMMSNTWGDRSKDGRVNEHFLMQELRKAAELGLDIVQIDDGWQKGVSSNSVAAAGGNGRWGDFYSGGGDFWSHHPERFPNGLGPVAELARQLGVKLGLWFSLDTTNDYIHWEQDAARMLELHRQYGIAAFKLDGIDIRSKTGEQRLCKAMQQVVLAARGRVQFNLDATAQKRLGYFGRTQYGSIFLENRYTDWLNYYPHWTLRNLWTLCPYLPARRLQMEFLNVERNVEKYGADPLAPARCGQLYALAAAMFANPLAWMELSGLNDAQSEALTAVIRAVKPHHSAILAGHILPLGQEPSGAEWTGLQSISSADSGYLLIFRELAPAPSAKFRLWNTESSPIVLEELIRVDGGSLQPSPPQPLLLQPDSRGEYGFALPAPFSFVLYKYTRSLSNGVV